MEWLFLNARGKHAEAASILSKLILSGDASGDASKLVGPSADPKGLPLRAALLRKATVLLQMRQNLTTDEAAVEGADAKSTSGSLSTTWYTCFAFTPEACAVAWISHTYRVAASLMELLQHEAKAQHIEEFLQGTPMKRDSLVEC